MSKYTVFQYLPAEKIDCTLKRLFPYPEDMGPFPYERYHVRVELVNQRMFKYVQCQPHRPIYVTWN